ncbi:hypothetical protein BD410DRAFT_893140 [Rickenella mellea]|uniref:Uncharacterized protein n=1 Tax=Rickenella mellea TaxID=50990 RepID=A0A4R5XFJ5_9AGAM|nr:hypothetical protein BD410DRAFT_893140 [Rickenella mellea]
MSSRIHNFSFHHPVTGYYTSAFYNWLRQPDITDAIQTQLEEHRINGRYPCPRELACKLWDTVPLEERQGFVEEGSTEAIYPDLWDQAWRTAFSPNPPLAEGPDTAQNPTAQVQLPQERRQPLSGPGFYRRRLLNRLRGVPLPDHHNNIEDVDPVPLYDPEQGETANCNTYPSAGTQSLVGFGDSPPTGIQYSLPPPPYPG